MTDLERFERTLTERMLAHAGTVDTPFDARRIARETAAAPGPSLPGRLRDVRRAAPGRRLTAAFTGVLLVGAAATLGLSGQRSPQPPSVPASTVRFLSLGPTGLYPDDGFAVAPLPDGRALVVAYDSDQTIGVTFDPVTLRFQDAGQAPVTLRTPTIVATPLHDGRVLVTGPGSDAPAQIWDPASSSFRLAGAPSRVLSLLQPFALPDGRLLFGRGAGAQVFDPATESFTPAGAAGDRPILPAGTWMPDGRLFVTGAEVSWLVDPATGDQESTGGLDDGADWHAWSASRHWTEPCAVVVLADGGVLALGGRRLGAESLLPATDDAGLWEPSTGTFHRVGPLPDRLEICAAAALPDGRALIIQGGSGEALLATPS